MRSYISIVVVVVFIFSTIPLPAQQRQPKPYLAVMDLQIDVGLQKSLGAALADKVRETIMATEKYLIIDRGNIEIIMKEIARGQEGCYDESCAVEAGRLLSAHFIITGRVVKLGPNECQVSVQMTDVARAEIVKVASDNCACEGAALAGAAENVAMDIMGIARQPGKLVIQSNPSGAIVFIDGERKGTTPFGIEVKPGKHKIMVTRRGFELEEQSINVAPGASMSLNFSLNKAKKKWHQTWWFYTTVGVLIAGGAAGAFAAGGGGGGGGSTPPPTSTTPTGTVDVTGSLP